ncbi:hypothetical protein A9Q02_21305 [Candidatus Chloroploca asiatica]|uniref:Uncharacterized protein n=1 Tax=Candidatus Chloroploca asiatica TaxID=1506545 RepID=A0A2H3KZB3_9CHLR|nr:hypothetical protein A9Q02_21305 [Candidatus Chloroploca asiatica]
MRRSEPDGNSGRYLRRYRANIVLPGSLHFMWWLARFSPTLWRWLSLLHIRVLRTKVRMPTQPMASR